MWGRIYTKTNFSLFTNKEIKQMAAKGLSEAAVEYICRYFNSSWFMPFTSKEEAQAICDAQIQKAPQHNLFNYARAQLTINNTEKLKYLKTAAKSCEPHGTLVSAQAAYEAAGISYPTKKEKGYTAYLAWLSRAIILGSEPACQNFLDNNMCGLDEKFNLTLMYCVFLTVHLSGKKITGLIAGSKIIKTVSGNNLLAEAYYHPNLAASLVFVDSPARKVVEQIIMRQPQGFLSYFSYCYLNEIISADIFRTLVNIYLSSLYTDQDNLRQYAIDLIKRQKLEHLFVEPTPQPQPPVFYFMPTDQHTASIVPYPTAPLATYPQSTYQYLYTQAPQMIPMQAPQIFLAAPTSTLLTVVPATPFNTVVTDATQTQPNELLPQYISFKS